jgi:glyoxylase-like metal-dependent hydrolase (beta-lactamase superfamily II)
MEKGKEYPFIPESIKPLLYETKKYVNVINGDMLGEFKVINTPYLFHSYGMVMYLYKNALFCGDFIQSKSGEFMLIPKEYNLDEQVYINYIKNFDMSDIKYIFQAHGKPLLVENNWKRLIETIK